MKIQKFWIKRSFRSRILGETPVWSEQILVSCQTRFSFLNHFQIIYASSNTVKELSKFLVFKKSLKFLLKNEGFVTPPPYFFFQNLHLLSDFNAFFCSKTHPLNMWYALYIFKTKTLDVVNFSFNSYNYS